MVANRGAAVAFLDVSIDGQQAIDLAWLDVSRAFDAFQKRCGSDRPSILAGHSQGSSLLERSTHRKATGTPAEHPALHRRHVGEPGPDQGLGDSATSAARLAHHDQRKVTLEHPL